MPRWRQRERSAPGFPDLCDDVLVTRVTVAFREKQHVEAPFLPLTDSDHAVWHTAHSGLDHLVDWPSQTPQRKQRWYIFIFKPILGQLSSSLAL